MSSSLKPRLCAMPIKMIFLKLYVHIGMIIKVCKVCGEAKEAGQSTWVVHKGKPIGKTCKLCFGKKSLERYHKDEHRKKTVREAALSRYHKNPSIKLYNKEYCRKRYATPEGRLFFKAASAKYSRENAAKVAALAMKRYTAKLLRQPKWADLHKIEAFYIEAAKLTELTGIRYEVDHIIPLQGLRVSGLHVHNNLQILSKSENSSKGNKFDMEAFNNKFVS